MTTALLITLISARAFLLDCHDGDTCTFVVETPLKGWVQRDVRLCDIDTPEMKTTTMAAAENARHAALTLMTLDRFVDLKFPPRTRTGKERMSFTRYLAWVRVGGLDVGEMLLKRGHAVLADKRCPR